MSIRKFIKKILTGHQAVNRASLKDYLVGENSVIYEEGEIINNLKDKDKIKIGNNTHVRGQLLTFAHGGKIELGDYCYIGRNSYIWSARHIKIGDRVLISHNCNIFDSDTHPLDARKRHEQCKAIFTTGHPVAIDLGEDPVIIEDDAWISAGSIILKGVKVGKGAVVGAGSVVTSDVPPYSIVAGNPAKYIKDVPVTNNLSSELKK
jgi:acetyltransferase-like isoleucine patch superfamily enzyme